MKLQNTNIQIQIEPNLGACLQLFTFKGKNVLRPANTSSTIPQDQSMFVMIPYCSYIKDGHFNYFGITRHFPANQPNTSNPMHGDVWLNPCQIEKQTDTSVSLSYTHKKDQGFPFDYKATITYTLDKNKLKVTLAIYNSSELPMPCGMGLHPYFANAKTAQVQFKSTHIWYHKQDPIFDRPYPTPNEWNFDKGKQIKDVFDTAFGGWDGEARITYPDEQLQIDITAQDIFHHIVLYAPPQSDFFCLEPVSNTPDAFNLAAYGVIGTGIQSIGSKQTLTKTITFTCQNI